MKSLYSSGFSRIYSALFCQNLGRIFYASVRMRSIWGSDSLGIPLIQSWEARRTLNVKSQMLFGLCRVAERKKGRFICFSMNHPVELGIINHTAQWPLCRARHNRHFQPGINVARPNVTPPRVMSSSLPLSKVRISSGFDSFLLCILAIITSHFVH